jgi:LPXTG-motif cell wall-anchored protein
VSAACEDNYVVSCNPAPKTPVAEVIVIRHEPALAVTGAQFDPTLTIAGSAAIIIGAIILGRRAKNNRSFRD